MIELDKALAAYEHAKLKELLTLAESTNKELFEKLKEHVEAHLRLKEKQLWLHEYALTKVIELYELTPDAEDFDIRMNKGVARSEALPRLRESLEKARARKAEFAELLK